jgi:hypothetical protein
MHGADVPSPPTEFQLELKRICKLAWTDGSPKACAEEYRMLADSNPTHRDHGMLKRYARDWDKLGDSWMGPGAKPKSGNVMTQMAMDMGETELQDEVERQLAKAKERGWL